MATTPKSASSRLTDIWTQWSLGATLSDADARTQKSALAALVAALVKDEPHLALRSMQAILVDPEQPGASARPLFKPLWELVRAHWDTAGTGNHADTMRLQALLLAAWGERLERSSEELIPTLVSPWGAVVGRERQRPAILTWLEDFVRDEQDTWIAPTSADDPDEEGDALRRIRSSYELLWWGQALYCYSRRCSFRRLMDPDEATWWAAVEAARRATTLPVEPAASYLQEVLRTAGVAVDELRSVSEHAHALRRVLKRHPQRDSAPQDLAKLVREDPFGLPINLLCVEPDASDDRLCDGLGVEPDRPLSRGDWAAWVFRELLLQRRWPALEPTT